MEKCISLATVRWRKRHAVHFVWNTHKKNNAFTKGTINLLCSSDTWLTIKTVKSMKTLICQLVIVWIMSVFQSFDIQSLTQTIYEMTQFKMLCGTYDPLWLIFGLNTGCWHVDQGYPLRVSINTGPQVPLELVHVIQQFRNTCWIPKDQFITLTAILLAIVGPLAKYCGQHNYR